MYVYIYSLCIPFQTLEYFNMWYISLLSIYKCVCLCMWSIDSINCEGLERNGLIINCRWHT